MATLTPRQQMTADHLAGRGIEDRRVLAAFERVDRRAFVPAALAGEAYADHPLPIGEEQTISQPYIVARTLAALELTGSERVLEVGTGSGYAAALLAELGREVDTVERLSGLAAAARKNLASAGYGKIRVHVGDGSLGWPEHAPYDAIAVAAAGPVVPQALLDQLAVGGRLVIPVTRAGGRGQVLRRVRRTSERDLETDDLDPVIFVPLIGAQAHDVAAHPESAEQVLVVTPRIARPGTSAGLARLVREVADPIDDDQGGALARLVDRLSSARLVLLGESTHGTRELYRLRARITRELLTRHGFDFIAVEADWPDAAALSDATRPRGAPAVASTEPDFVPFSRFPRWMWRNEEIAGFARWLREHNAAAGPRGKVGFHGLDLYSMYTSIAAVLRYLESVDQGAAERARDRYARLFPWRDEPERYGQLVARGTIEPAEEAVIGTLRDLLRRRLEYATPDGERFFDAAQNARLVTDAERYYRAMYRGSIESWNLRDSHMFETLRLLLAFHGPSSRGIVWAHNSHVGDARATEDGARGEHTLGQLCRQALGDATRLVGLSTDHGEVSAASAWDEPVQTVRVRPGHPESYERVFHETKVPAFVLSLREPRRRVVRDELAAARLFRFIGVVYRPDTELTSHYLETALSTNLDELIWIDETHAVRPLPDDAPLP